MAAKKITLEVFLRHLKERHGKDYGRRFCFILGSGASIESGIPTGAELVDRWLASMHADEPSAGQSLEDWSTIAFAGVEGFTYARRAEFYGEVYERMFQGQWDAGYDELETTFAEKDPSFGYSVLAWIMAHTGHRVVITPNFDNLVADALFIYSNVAPIICVHESLAGYVTHQVHRPLIVKFHRDLLFDPKSRKEQLLQLPQNLVDALTNLFRNFTPVVIGYGGNDPGFMKLLQDLPPGVPDRLYWCNYGDNPLNARVQQLLDQRDAFLVPTLGFDRLMLRLREALQVPDLVADVQERHAERMERYRKKLDDLLAETQARSGASDATPEEKQTAEAARVAALETKFEDTPQSWLLRARAEQDADLAEALYRQALEKHAGHGDLMAALGELLADKKQRFDEAEDLIRMAYEQDPENPSRQRDYGTFLYFSRGDGKRAEPLLRQAVAALTARKGADDLDTLSCRNRLANALWAQGKHAEAEREHRKVLALRERMLGAEHSDTLSSRNNLAAALQDQGKHAEAERELRAVISIEERLLEAEHPHMLSSRSNLATALDDQGKHAEAEREYRAALVIQEQVRGAEHPDVLRSCYNLALCLEDQGKIPEALEISRRAYEGWRKVLGEEHPDTKDARNLWEQFERDVRKENESK